MNAKLILVLAIVALASVASAKNLQAMLRRGTNRERQSNDFAPATKGGLSSPSYQQSYSAKEAAPMPMQLAAPVQSPEQSQLAYQPAQLESQSVKGASHSMAVKGYRPAAFSQTFSRPEQVEATKGAFQHQAIAEPSFPTKAALPQQSVQSVKAAPQLEVKQPIRQSSQFAEAAPIPQSVAAIAYAWRHPLAMKVASQTSFSQAPALELPQSSQVKEESAPIVSQAPSAQVVEAAPRPVQVEAQAPLKDLPAAPKAVAEQKSSP